MTHPASIEAIATAIATKTKFSPTEVRDILEYCGLSPASEAEAFQAVTQFQKWMSDSGFKTVRQAIGSTTKATSANASNPTSANASNPTSANASNASNPTSGFQFNGLNRDLLDQIGEHQGLVDYQSNQAAQLQGMLEALKVQAGMVAGKERLDAMMLGLIEPENDAERQILAIAQKMRGFLQPKLPPFATVQEDGTVCVDLSTAFQSFNPNSLIGAPHMRQIEATK